MLIKLHKLLQEAHQNQSSISLHLIGVLDGETKAGRITLDNGQVRSISCGNLTPTESLFAIQEMRIEKITQHPALPASHSGGRGPVPNITAVLCQIENSPNYLTNELTTLTSSIIESALGKSSVSRIKDMARTHNPHLEPKEFVEGCKDLLANMVGPSQAEKMLRPVYKLLE